MICSFCCCNQEGDLVCCKIRLHFMLTTLTLTVVGRHQIASKKLTAVEEGAPGPLKSPLSLHNHTKQGATNVSHRGPGVKLGTRAPDTGFGSGQQRCRIISSTSCAAARPPVGSLLLPLRSNRFAGCCPAVIPPATLAPLPTGSAQTLTFSLPVHGLFAAVCRH